MNKIIHQIFLDIGLTPLSERKDYLYNIEIIKRNNPNWKHILWNDKMVNDFVKKFYPEYLSIWNNFPNKFYKIDYVRYLILNTYGGIYVDLDELNIRPFDKKFTKSEFIIGSFESKTAGNIINNNIIAINDKKYTKKLIDYCNNQLIEKKESIPKTWKIRLFLHSVGAQMFKRFCKLNKIETDIDTRIYFKQHKAKDFNLSWIASFGNKIDYKNINNSFHYK